MKGVSLGMGRIAICQGVESHDKDAGEKVPEHRQGWRLGEAKEQKKEARTEFNGVTDRTPN